MSNHSLKRITIAETRRTPSAGEPPDTSATTGDEQEQVLDRSTLIMSRRELLVIGAITGLGALLRLFQLGAQSLWYDELLSVVLARRDWSQIIAGTIQADVHPPLFYLLLHVPLQFGSDESAARILSCLFSVATIPLFYAVARQWFDRDVAVLATGIAALNPLQVLFAQEARMYAQLCFFTLAALLFLERAARQGRTRDWALFAGTVIIILYSHNLAFLYLLALDGVALIERRRLRGQWRRLLMAHVIVAIAFAPWVPSMLQQLERVRAGFWGTTPSALTLLAAPYLLLFGTSLPSVLVPFALFAGLALVAFALMASIRVWRARQPEAPGLAMATVIFLMPLMLLFLLSLLGPIFVERVLLPASHGLYLLLAWALLRAQPRALNVVLGAVALLATLGSLFAYNFDPSMQKPHLREVARSVAATIQPGDVIVHTSDSSALAFAYYVPQLPLHFLVGDPDFERGSERAVADRYAGITPEGLDSLVANHTRLWLVVALDHNEDYQRNWVTQLDARYRRASTDTIFGVNLFLFQLSAAVQPAGSRVQRALQVTRMGGTGAEKQRQALESVSLMVPGN